MRKTPAPALSSSSTSWWNSAFFSPPSESINKVEQRSKEQTTKVRNFSRPAFASPLDSSASRRPSHPNFTSGSSLYTEVSSNRRFGSSPDIRSPSLEKSIELPEVKDERKESWRQSIQMASPLDQTPKIPTYTGLNSGFNTPAESRRNSIDIVGSLGPLGIPIPQVAVYDFDAMQLEREMRELKERQDHAEKGDIGLVMTPDIGDKYGFSGGMLLETGSIIQDPSQTNIGPLSSSTMDRKPSVEGLASQAKKLLTGLPLPYGKRKVNTPSNPHEASDAEVREVIERSKRRAGLR